MDKKWTFGTVRSRLSQKLKQEWCIVVWMAFWDFAKVSFKFQGVALNAVWSSRNLEIRCLNDAWKKGLSFTKWWKERVSNCLSSFGLDGVRQLNRASHCSKSQLFVQKLYFAKNKQIKLFEFLRQTCNDF